MSEIAVTTNPVPAPAQTLMQKGVEKLRQHAELKTMAFDYADFITQTGACPDIYKGKPMDAAAAIIRGTALGFDPDGALEAFFVIKGKTGMYARAMIAVAENIGCRVWEESATDTEVVWCGHRPGDDKVERVVWTLERAKTAGYLNNQKYKTNPQEMLRAKCQAELARIIAPGALMGLVSEVEKEEAQRTVQATATRQDSPRQERGADAVRAALAAKPVDITPYLEAIHDASDLEELQHAVPADAVAKGTPEHARLSKAWQARKQDLEAELYESQIQDAEEA